MALEEFCAKQTSEIMQLNRLVKFSVLSRTISLFFVYVVVNECLPCICRCNSTSMRWNAML